MTMIRIHKKTKNFLILDKTCLQDERLSWGAKGLHAYLMSMPDNWNAEVEDLKMKSTNGRDAVRKRLNMLEKYGYISKEPIRDEKGRYLGLGYVVYETPIIQLEEEGPETASQSKAYTGPENPFTENTTLIINKESNKDLKQEEIKAAAEGRENEKTNGTLKAAAAAFSKKGKQNEKPMPPITNGSPQDAIIGETFTAYQISRIEKVVRELGLDAYLQEEIMFCLQSKAQFKACGEDFSRKLNAIRTVIKRGEWQTPTEMIRARQSAKASVLSQLEQAFQEFHSEAKQAEQLLHASPPQSRQAIETWLKEALNKKATVQAQIDAFHQALAS